VLQVGKKKNYNSSDASIIRYAAIILETNNDLKNNNTKYTLSKSEDTQKQFSLSLKCHCSVCVRESVFAVLDRLSQFYLI